MEEENEDGDQNDQEVTEETEETKETERDGVGQNHQINLLNSMKHSFIKPKRLLYQPKNLQLLRDEVPQTPTKFYTTTKFNDSVTSNNY